MSPVRRKFVNPDVESVGTVVEEECVVTIQSAGFCPNVGVNPTPVKDPLADELTA